MIYRSQTKLIIYSIRHKQKPNITQITFLYPTHEKYLKMFINFKAFCPHLKYFEIKRKNTVEEIENEHRKRVINFIGNSFKPTICAR